MNILYLHGLDSKLNSEKRKILEKFGNVFAPDLDYYNDEKAIDSIQKLFPGEEMNVVIGSSMGGFAGYHVANILNKPALLFNPALQKRSVQQVIPEYESRDSVLRKIVLGQLDEVVNPADTLLYISENDLQGKTDLYLHLRPDLSHRIPTVVFEEEVADFFKKLRRD